VGAGRYGLPPFSVIGNLTQDRTRRDLNIGGIFYYVCSVLDGFSRFIVNWEIRESITEADIEIILQGAKEKYPEARPRIPKGRTGLRHIGQRAAVRRQGLQGVHSDLGNDPRPDLSVLSAIEREDRALAQIA